MVSGPHSQDKGKDKTACLTPLPGDDVHGKTVIKLLPYNYTDFAYFVKDKSKKNKKKLDKYIRLYYNCAKAVKGIPFFADFTAQRGRLGLVPAVRMPACDAEDDHPGAVLPKAVPAA